MKRGSYAIYKGKEYECGFGNEFLSNEEYIVLISNDKRDLMRGFLKDGPNRLYKHVKPDEVEAAYRIRVSARYKGLDFAVMAEEGGKYLLYGGYNDGVMKDMGFRFIDRGQYDKWVDKFDVEKVWEVREPIKL